MEFRYLWRDAVTSKDGPESPIVRLALLGLELYMDAAGECYPSTRTIAERTGLDRRTVMTALRGAEKTGWIEIITGMAFRDQHYKRHKYMARIPKNLVHQSHQHAAGLGASDVPTNKGDLVHPMRDLVHPMHRLGTPDAPEPTIEPINNQPIENIRCKSVSVSKNKHSKASAISPVAIEL